MVGRSRFVTALLCSYYTAAIANHAAGNALQDHDHNMLKRTGGAQGGAIGNSPSLSMPTWTVPATGSGTSYAEACNSESAVYDTLLSYGVTPTGDDDSLATSWTETTSYTAETTRLCDGRVRVLGSLTPVSVGSVLTTDVPTITYTGPAPSCSVSPSDCSWLRKSYLSAQSSFSASLSQYPDAPPGESPQLPRCYIPGKAQDVCGQCTIHGDHVELLYFPVTTEVSRDMCATTPTSPVVCPFGPTHSNDDTIKGFATAPCPYIDIGSTSMTDSGPSTIINGTIFYSNRAYISYNTLYATNSCGRVGGAYSNGLVTVASSDIYSLSGYHFYMDKAAYSFNFADLIPPIPASAYLCQATCYDSGSPLNEGDMLNGMYGGRLGFCSIIIDEEFKPWIAVPPAMRNIDPQFKDCLLGLDALYDPPRMMVSEATLDGPFGPTQGSAEPQQGVSPAYATARPTALMESQTPESATPTLSGTVDTAGGSSHSNTASTPGSGGAANSTSTGVNLAFTSSLYAVLFWVLLLSYMVWW